MDSVRVAMDRQGEILPPDLLLLDPEGRLLDRLASSASAEETLALLRRHAPGAEGSSLFLADRPDSPGGADLARLEVRWRLGERASLVVPLSRWVDAHGGAELEPAALLLLGAALYHGGRFDEADQAWRRILREHLGHPLRHRAEYNLLDVLSWQMNPMPELRGARHPLPGERPTVDPWPERRQRNWRETRERCAVTPSGIPLVEIPAGTFRMGGDRFPREQPHRKVTLSRPFRMAAWAATRAQWRRFRPEDLGPEGDPVSEAVPVLNASHEAAEEFCRFLGEVDGVEYRLATEAEWEYAARGGLEGCEHPWGDEPADPTRCNFEHSAGVPVASYEPNGFGLFDMVGNQAQWVADSFHPEAYALTPEEVTDPVHRGDPPYVLRGGFPGLSFCRYQCRNAIRLTSGHGGVRLVCDGGAG